MVSTANLHPYSTGKDFLVRASFLEIYNENIRDLLAKDQSKTCDLKETPDQGGDGRANNDPGLKATIDNQGRLKRL